MSEEDDDELDPILPRNTRTRRTVTLAEPIDEYLEEHVGNVSGFVERILWDALGEELPEDGPHYDFPSVQRRIFKLQLNAVRKEIHDLEQLEFRLERALEEMEDEPDPWNHRLQKILRGYKDTSHDNSKLIEGSDPEEDDEG